jgi:hypothetical protein
MRRRAAGSLGQQRARPAWALNPRSLHRSLITLPSVRALPIGRCGRGRTVARSPERAARMEPGAARSFYTLDFAARLQILFARPAYKWLTTLRYLSRNRERSQGDNPVILGTCHAGQVFQQYPGILQQTRGPDRPRTCVLDISVACSTTPERLRREAGAIGEGAQLGPGEVGVDPAAEAAIGAGDDVLAADDRGVA